ncbi:MAG: family 78 glycoside hydrolase catalytic domain, partial [Candidatus Brocadiia bacterium]
MAGVEAVSAPQRLRCEYRENPLGIEEIRPRLSWWVADGRRGAVQTAYHILVAGSPEALNADEGDLWDSGKVPSDRNFNVVYGGRPLGSRRRCWWKVRTYDAEDVAGPWSKPARWEMGLLEPGDWAAQWIGAPGEAEPEAVTYLRGEFTAQSGVAWARLYATALGVYELRLNGQKVGDQVLTPGWTDYRARVMYQTYDVTEQLRVGPNALGALLGEGWYCGRIGWAEEGEAFGPRPPRLLAQLELHYADGRTERFVTDGAWRCSDGPVARSGIYPGEHYDARRRMPGWDQAGFPAEDWRTARTFQAPEAALAAQQDPPIRVTQELRPVEVRRQGQGAYVFDFGQNMVGVCRLQVRAPKGTEIRLRHAELLDTDGPLYTENLRTAEATDTFVLSGEGEEVLVPRF